MKIEPAFFITDDKQQMEITVMHCTEKELKAHQLQLEEIGIRSIIYESYIPDFDRLFATDLGGFWVQFEDK